MILDGRGRNARLRRAAGSRRAPQPHARLLLLRPQAARPTPKPIYDEDLHGAPTMIIDINRMRRRRG